MNMAEVRGLTKRYPAFTLQEVSFGIRAGRITGFIGRNGAGKTTTIKAMLNLIHPDSGAVSFFGMPFPEHETEIKQRIGYSTGTVSWYPRKRIGEIVRVVRRFYDTWDDAAYRRYRALFSLDEDKTPIELSEGMKVKFNLLIALSHRAEMLILDEPTSGLDPFSRNELLELFLEVKKDGAAIFFSTHILSDIEQCADDIVYLSGGRVVAAMPRERFMEQYARPGERLEETVLRMEGGMAHA